MELQWGHPRARLGGSRGNEVEEWRGQRRAKLGGWQREKDGVGYVEEGQVTDPSHPVLVLRYKIE